MEERWQPVGNIDTGNFATDLEQQIGVTLDKFLMSQGRILINIQADSRRNEEFRRVAKPFYALSLARNKKIFERAVANGELPEDLDSDVASLILHGSISAKLAREQINGKPMSKKQKAEFVKSLTAMMLRAVGSQTTLDSN